MTTSTATSAAAAGKSAACAPLAALLRRLFGSCRQGVGRGGRRPDAFLTLYEMEMVPLMLKELDHLDQRFYQMVCYRWFREAPPPGDDGADGAPAVVQPSPCALSVDAAACSASTTTISTTSSSTTKLNRSVAPTFEDFVSEGQALRHLIRVLSRTLREVGSFDERCESALAAYRTRRQQWQAAASSDAVADGAARMRSFSSLPNAPAGAMAAAAAAAVNGAYADSGADSGTTPILLLNNEPNDGEESKNSGGERAIQRRRPATTIVDSRSPTGPNESVAGSAEPAAGASRKKMSKKAARKQRQRAAARTDALFAQLGEILCHQFHTTVTINDHKQQKQAEAQKQQNATKQQDENVHERELRVLIWRHFVQMLVAMLTDRDRFPV